MDQKPFSRAANRLFSVILLLSLLSSNFNGDVVSSVQAAENAELSSSNSNQSSKTSFKTTGESLEVAFQVALEQYNNQFVDDFPFVITNTQIEEGFAYANAAPIDQFDQYVQEEVHIILLAHQNLIGEWHVVAPKITTNQEYNSVLDSFPDSLIDSATKAFIYQSDFADSSIITALNIGGHKLPWGSQKTAQVRAKGNCYVNSSGGVSCDNSGHDLQLDFSIEGSGINGDVYASKPGTVVYVKESSNSGACSFSNWKQANIVVIQHGASEYSWYVHLAYNSVPVSEGQQIDFGTRIGIEGNTGFSCGVHLHYMTSTGHTTGSYCNSWGCWTDPSNPNDAPWATGITAVDFAEVSWDSMAVGSWYSSQNSGGGGGTNNPPAGFAFCSNEGGRCNFDGTADVVYGALNSFTSPRSFTNGVDCNNSVFGDPISGTAKSCYYKPTGGGCPSVSGIVRLYDGTNCNTPSVDVGLGLSQLESATYNFNDRAESIAIPSGWSTKLYLHNSESSPSVCVASTDDNLSDKVFSDGTVVTQDGGQTTWIRVYNNSSCTGGTPPNPPNPISPANGQSFNEGDAINLSWSSTGNEYYGEVWGGPAGTTFFDWQTGTSKNIGSQWAGYVYSWHVKARNSYGPSDWSFAPTFIVRPGAPTNLSASVASCSQINLSWSDNSGNEEGYKVYRNGSLIATLPSGSTSYPSAGLSANTNYSYYVIAYRGNVVSNQSNTANGTTSTCSVTTPSLIAPTNGQFYNEGDSINLSWTATGSEYYGEISGGPGGTLTFGWQTGASKNIGSQWAGHVYFWRVMARVGTIESGWSNWSGFTVRPAAPTNLSASVASCSQINLSWSDNSGNEEGYKVYRNGSLIATLGSGVTSYQSTGLAGNTNYSYTVKAYRGSIESNSSNTASAITSACPIIPPTPPNFRVIGSTQTSITLAWDDVSNETGYKIYEWNGSTFVYLASVGPNVTTFTEDRGICGWDEFYELSAYNGNGESDHTFWIHGHTKPCTPVPSIPENGSSKPYSYDLTFQWNSASEATEYLIEWWGGPYTPMQPCGWSSSTSCHIGPVATGHTYSWHVKARNSAGESPWSSTWTFTIQPQTYTLTINKSGTGSGTVTSNPVGINCGADCSEVFTNNTQVNLTATPTVGSSFVGWSGDADCSDGVVTVNANKSCTATFNANVTQQPDLIIQSITSIPANPQINGPVTFSVVIKNQGQVNAGAFYVDLFIDDSIPLDCSGVGQSYQHVSSLAAGASQTLSLAYMGFTSPGSHTVNGVVDTNCGVNESNESNNTKSLDVSVGGGVVFVSVATQDGFILESTETSGVGGTKNNTAQLLRVGDDVANKQYRAILSFDTLTLPDDAVITSVTLRFKQAGVVETNPFTTHGKLLADICEGAFKNDPVLQLADFKAQCPSGFYKVKALIYTNTKVDNWYSQSLLPEDFQFINLVGVTQFRLRFARDDNNDFGADFLKLFSGNAAEADRPQLVIEYHVP